MLESSTYRYILQQGFEIGFKEGFEIGFEEGFEIGARERTIDVILEALEIKFEARGVQTLRPMLEAIEELQRLKDLRRAAMQLPSLEAFMRTLMTNGNSV